VACISASSCIEATTTHRREDERLPRFFQLSAARPKLFMSSATDLPWRRAGSYRPYTRRVILRKLETRAALATQVERRRGFIVSTILETFRRAAVKISGQSKARLRTTRRSDEGTGLILLVKNHARFSRQKIGRSNATAIGATNITDALLRKAKGTMSARAAWARKGGGPSSRTR
jgi:hypothetical protein